VRLIKKWNLKLKEKIKHWLGIDELERMLNYDIKVVRSLLEASNRRCGKIEDNIKDICNNAIIGVDLSYRDSSAIIIIKYSRLTNGFTVIEDSQCKFVSYRQMVHHLRKLVRSNMVDITCIDEPPADYPIAHKILPNRALIDYYAQRERGKEDV